MKYYVPIYKYSSSRSIINIGDDIQSLAVEDMLKGLSIEHEQIGYIARSEMGVRQVNREKGIFIPATGGLAWNSYPAKDDLPINDYNLRILYFGTRIPEGMFDAMRHYDAFISSMKKYEPIGCRDVATRDYLRTLGVKAFYSKCVSLGFGYRNTDIKREKIFIVDIPEEVDDVLKEIMPQTLMKETEYLSQEFILPRNDRRGHMTDAEAMNVYQLAKERLELYKREAKLVITKRIHVAMPCAAMGIPVIFFNDENDSRRSVASSVLKSYTKQTIREYDWNRIETADIDDTKREIRLLFNLRLQQEEAKMGISSQHLSYEEYTEALELLELRCNEQAPLNSYVPQVFSVSNMVTALLGEKRDDVSKLSRPVVLFGAGDLSRRILVILKRYGINPVCFCDNKISEDETAWYENLPLISFKKLIENHKNSYIIITSREGEEQIRTQLAINDFNEDLIIGCEDYYIPYHEYLPPPIVYGSDFM